jgi:dTDP-4-amino-4,6-dideoxygalactose transaminase
MKIQISRPMIGSDEEKAVLEVLRSGALAQGTRVKEFEEVFASYTGTRYAVATSSGTTALHTLLLALGIGKGDEVITTPFTFIATANSILYCGGRPVFADIEPKTFNINPEEIKERISPKTKAVLAVHLFGQPCDMKAIVEICEDHHLLLIEDACQAHGAEFDGKKVGSFGYGVFSFYPTKNMTTGEGGMITTDDEEVARRARLLRQHGSAKGYHHEILGYNFRMTDVGAAIGIEQLKKLDGFIDSRRRNARMLTEGINEIDGIDAPFVSNQVKHVFNQYTIRVNGYRDNLKQTLEDKGIGTGIYYPIPIHQQEIYIKSESRLREAERASKEVLSLPVHPGVGKKEIEHILSCLEGGE